MSGKVFTEEEQELFAALSGDRNPLHMDMVLARRLLFGRRVVHGVHLLLWALDCAVDGGREITGLTAHFKAPLGLGEPVDCQIEGAGQDKFRLTLRNGEQLIAFADVTVAPLGDVGGPAIPGGDPSQPCRVRMAGELSSACGSLDLTLDGRLARALFPRLAQGLPPHRLAFLLATTRLIGMECPGLHSVFAHLDVRYSPCSPAAPARLAWRVKDYAERFSRLAIAVDGPGCSGIATAFLRPPPRHQPSFAAMRGQVSPQAFLGQRALVIGGSRGLGELCSKLLAAGGASVRLTYHQGAVDAAAVRDDIVEGGGDADISPYDVLGPAAALLAGFGEGWFPSHLYYFATPAITGNAARFSTGKLETLCRYYAGSFVQLAIEVRKVARGGLSVFYPSSVAVENPPANMMEYATAKAAGEAACRLLMARDEGLRIVVERLPRLPTDLTSSIIPVAAADPLPLLRDILSRMATAED